MAFKKESDKHLKMDKKSSSFRKVENKDFKSNDEQTKTASSNKNASGRVSFKDKTKESFSKGFETYQDELQSDDLGIESSGKMGQQSFKATKSTVNKLRNHHKNKKENKPKKVDDEQLKSTKEKLGIDDKGKDLKQGKSKLRKSDDNFNSEKIKKNSTSRTQSNNALKRADEEQLKNVKDKLGREHKNKQTKPTSKFTKGSKKDIKGNKTNGKGFMNKVLNQPKKLTSTAKNKGVESFKETIESEDDGVKVGSKSSKLVKDSVKSVNQAKRVQRKSSAAKKLKGHNTKLKTDNTLRKTGLNPKVKKGQKALLKKRTMRRSIYASKGRNPATLTQTVKNSGVAIKNGMNAIKKLSVAMFRKMMATKMFAWLGALSIKLIPVAVVMGILLGIVILVMSMGSGGGNEEMNQAGDVQGLNPEVEQWRELVTEVAEEKNMSDYVGLVLAIIQIESGGKQYKDIMQSSESAGHPRNYIQDERKSIEQGISHLKNVVNLLKGYGNNLENDTKLIAQTYNFGLGFAHYVGGNDYKQYDLSIAEKFSREVVAPSLGNSNGATYPYVNAISKSLGKTYLYSNGGNYLYGELIGQYIVEGNKHFADGELAPPVTPLIKTSGFGLRVSPGGIGSTNHKGIDFNCTGGVTPIHSVLNGQVVKSQWVNGFGNTVVVKHENSLYTLYAHMSSLSVNKGQKVNSGQMLGICGTTGNSTGAHLHLEVSPTPHANQVDPYPYFKHLIGG